MRLDQLSERLEFIPLSQLINDESLSATAHAVEPVPELLVNSVKELATSGDKNTRKSLRLLKVLTVLRDGETFQTIRRFFSREPFYLDNIDELVRHNLIESVPLSQSAPALGLRHTYLPAEHETPRLLRVPRQVRDYVNSIMLDEERDEIVGNAMGFLFGPQWWEKVKLRTTIENAYAHSSLVGPGNEHVIARLVLQRPIDRGNSRQVERYARVFMAYCAKLLEKDRYRDAAIATGAIIDLLEQGKSTKLYVELAQMHGLGLHMTGDTLDAINVLERVLEVGGKDLNEEFRSDTLLILALAYKKVQRVSDALTAARATLAMVLRLTEAPPRIAGL